MYDECVAVLRILECMDAGNQQNPWERWFFRADTGWMVGKSLGYWALLVHM